MRITLKHKSAILGFTALISMPCLATSYETLGSEGPYAKQLIESVPEADGGRDRVFAMAQPQTVEPQTTEPRTTYPTPLLVRMIETLVSMSPERRYLISTYIPIISDYNLRFELTKKLATPELSLLEEIASLFNPHCHSPENIDEVAKKIIIINDEELAEFIYLTKTLCKDYEKAHNLQQVITVLSNRTAEERRQFVEIVLPFIANERVTRGVSALGAHGTVRETLASYGS